MFKTAWPVEYWNGVLLYWSSYTTSGDSSDLLGFLWFAAPLRLVVLGLALGGIGMLMLQVHVNKRRSKQARNDSLSASLLSLSRHLVAVAGGMKMPSVPRFKAVLFDLGGTLAKTGSPSETYRRILAAHGIHASVDAIAEVHEESVKALDNREMAEEGAAFWLRWNARILERVGVKSNVDKLAKRISEVWWDYASVEIYSDVVDTLVKLKAKGIKLGIVTNGFKEDIDQIFQRLRLKGYFDVGIGADACKKAKPDAEIFLYALDKLGVCAEETLFVGDDVKKDYEGAKRAGLHALLVDRDGNVPQNREAIRSLVEVLEYV